MADVDFIPRGTFVYELARLDLAARLFWDALGTAVWPVRWVLGVGQ